MEGDSAKIAANVEFLGSRARELAEQEVERARSLDAKAGAIVVASVALGAASVAFIARLAALDGGTGAKALWAVEVAVGLAALLLGGALAVSSLLPRAVRSAVSLKEIRTWETPRALKADPVRNQGILLRASVHSVGVSRAVNRRKSKHLKWAAMIFAVALVSVVALTVSVAVHAAMYPAGGKGGSESTCVIREAATRKTNGAPIGMTHPTWTIRCSPYPNSTSSSARD